MRAFHLFQSHFNGFQEKTGFWLSILLGAAALVGLTLLEFPAPAHAQNAAPTARASADAQELAAQAAGLKKKMDELTAQNEQTKKEYDGKFEELRSYDVPLADYKRDLAAYEGELAQYEAANNSYKARLADYQSRCTQPADDASYNACVGEYGNLNAEHGGLNATFSGLDGRFSALNGRSAELNETTTALSAELDNYANTMKANFAEWNVHKDAFDKLSRELAGLSGAKAEECYTANTQVYSCNDPAFPKCSLNPARSEWVCLAQNATPCGTTAATWSCPAGQLCTGDGTTTPQCR